MFRSTRWQVHPLRTSVTNCIDDGSPYLRGNGGKEKFAIRSGRSFQLKSDCTEMGLFAKKIARGPMELRSATMKYFSASLWDEEANTMKGANSGLLFPVHQTFNYNRCRHSWLAIRVKMENGLITYSNNYLITRWD